MTHPTGPQTTFSTLNYVGRPLSGMRAYRMSTEDPLTKDFERNWEWDQHEVTIENLRGREDEAHLDVTGFELVKEKSAFWSEKMANSSTLELNVSTEEIQGEYYKECDRILRSKTGASKVIFFDYTIRQCQPGTADTVETRQPVAQTHVDQTPESALKHVVRLLPPNLLSGVLQRRYQLINLWRPIRNPAFDWPLAFCDFRTVDAEKDIFPISLIYPNAMGEIVGLDWTPRQDWKYFYGVSPDECILIKCFDSVRDGSVAEFAPHTAFLDPATPREAPLRESIEVRALLFYDFVEDAGTVQSLGVSS